MKRTIYILIFICLVVFAASAQSKSSEASSEDKKGFIGLSLGPAFSYTDFASKDINNENAGFAKTGFNLNVSFGYRLGRHFGIAAMLCGNSNSFDNAGFEKIFSTLAQVNSTPWKSNGVMAGGYYSSASSKVSFEMRLVIGYANTTSPEISVRLTDFSGAQVDLLQESVSGGTLCSDFGVGLKAALSEKFSFLGNLDFYATEPELSNVRTYIDGVLYDSSTLKQRVSIITITAGIAYNLK
ncbi:MAG: outer membrane beta-barrel protein [Bacteroidia bacterium]